MSSGDQMPFYCIPSDALGTALYHRVNVALAEAIRPLHLRHGALKVASRTATDPARDTPV